MPTIREIMQEERSRENGWVGMFLEGKFWKAYEQSAYVLSKLYNFKPTKRYIKAVNEDVISIGFPVEQLGKYLSGAIVEIEKKRCSARLQYSVDGFEDWKVGTRVKEPKPKNPVGKQVSLKKYALLCEQMVQVEMNLKSWKQYYSLKK